MATMPNVSKLTAGQLIDMLPAIWEIVDVLDIRGWLEQNKAKMPNATADQAEQAAKGVAWKLAGYVLKNFNKAKPAFFQLVGVAMQVPPEEAENMGGLVLMGTLVKLLYDKEAIDFFASLVGTFQQGTTPPNSAGLGA